MALPPLLTSLINKIEFRSTATPDLPLNLVGPSDPATQELISRLKPTFIFSGPAGRFVYAPGGQPQPGETLTEIKAGATVGGLGIAAALALAYALGKRSGR